MEFPAELRGEVERLLSEENTDKLAKAAEEARKGGGGNIRALPRERRQRKAAGQLPAGHTGVFRSENARDVRGCEPFAGAGSGVFPTGR